jgi:hypothetical protein
MWIYICVHTLTYVNAILNHPRSALVRGSGEFPANLRLADLNFTRPPRRAFPAVSLGFCLSATQFPCFGYEGKWFPRYGAPPFFYLHSCHPIVSPLFLSHQLTLVQLRGRGLRMRLGRLGQPCLTLLRPAVTVV